MDEHGPRLISRTAAAVQRSKRSQEMYEPDKKTQSQDDRPSSFSDCSVASGTTSYRHVAEPDGRSWGGGPPLATGGTNL